jgi:hypothetical protein
MLARFQQAAPGTSAAMVPLRKTGIVKPIVVAKNGGKRD